MYIFPTTNRRYVLLIMRIRNTASSKRKQYQYRWVVISAYKFPTIVDIGLLLVKLTEYQCNIRKNEESRGESIYVIIAVKHKFVQWRVWFVIFRADKKVIIAGKHYQAINHAIKYFTLHNTLVSSISCSNIIQMLHLNCKIITLLPFFFAT